jgi:hypothetical protein
MSDGTTTSPPAVHRTIVCAEIDGFGGRNDRDLLAIRGAMHDALRAALTKFAVSWSRCKLEDRGDGVVLLAPPDVPKIRFTDGFPRRLVQAIHEHNRTCAPSRRFRVRLAIHAGEVGHDEHGVAGMSLDHAFGC